MKKLLIVILLFSCTSFKNSYYATTWAGTANNQALTNEAMYDAFFSNSCTNFYLFSIGTPTFNSTGGNKFKLLTKDSLIAKGNYINLNTSYPPLSSKTGLQLVIKSDLTVVSTLGNTSSSTLNCVSSSTFTTVYFKADGTGKVYTNAAMTTTFTGNGNYYTSNDGIVIRITSNGDITYIGCPC